MNVALLGGARKRYSAGRSTPSFQVAFCCSESGQLTELVHRASEILKLASALFTQTERGSPAQLRMDFIDQHRDTHGVELICKVLQIAPSGYRRHAA